LLRTLYPLTAGTFTAIPATQFARLVELQEDDSVPSVGLVFKFPQDSYTAAYTYKQEAQPVVLGDKVAFGRGMGKFVGEPVQTGLNTRAADVYVMASCLTGTTQLRVTEQD
jgi:hypothetical protein